MTLALVTGTSSGIGLHTAIGLARSGVEVVATVRDASRADALRSAASEAGVELDVRSLDVTDAAGAQSLIEAVGPLDILVNNAGRGAVGTLEQLSDADLQEQLETNYLSVARLTRLVLPAMRERRRGRIIGRRGGRGPRTRGGGAPGEADGQCQSGCRGHGATREMGHDSILSEPSGGSRRMRSRRHNGLATPL